MQIIRKLSYLTSSQIAAFQKDGFLSISGIVSSTEVASMKRRADEHIESWRETQQCSYFNMSDVTMTPDTYFINSANKINIFLEQNAKKAKEKQAKVNKIGHALHDLDPLFRKFSYREEYRKIFSDLGYTQPKIVQSQYIIKAPLIGGQVNPHQDNCYIFTEPNSCIGVWIALDNATSYNACLFAVPGSHKLGTKRRWKRDLNTGEMKYSGSFEYDLKNAVSLEAEAGTTIILHGDLVHGSEQNISTSYRHAFDFHVVEGALEWAKENWIQRSSCFPFRKWE